MGKVFEIQSQLFQACQVATVVMETAQLVLSQFTKLLMQSTEN